MVISIIAPVAVAGILILVILAATVNAQEGNSTGNEQQQSNNAGNGQQSSSNAGNATSTGAPENTTSTGGSTANTVLPSGGSTPGNNTGNATGVDANSILAVYNRERAAVNASLQPYVWDDTLAAHAKAWVDYLAAGKAGGKVVHCNQVPGCETPAESETLAMTSPGRADPADMIQATWMQEKPTGHYLAIVSPNAKSVGCGFATSTNITDAEGKPYGPVVSILVCRYR